MQKIYRYFFFVILYGSAVVHAGGRYAGASLELGVGARPLSLASSAAAMIGTGETFYYNPASLGFLSKTVVNLMYAPTFGSIYSPTANYHYAGFASPLPMGGTVAINWTRFAVDDIPIYPKLQGNSFMDRKSDIRFRPDGTTLGYFQDTEDVYYFSFSRLIRTVIPLGWLYIDLPLEIPLGVNFKFLRQSLYTHKASGIGIDLGTMVRFSLKTLFDERKLGVMTLGVSISDISHTSILWDTRQEDRIHRSVSFGAAYEHLLWKEQANLNFYWTYYKKYSSYHLLAIELKYHGLAIRLGKTQMGITTGAGIQLWKICTDYAFVTNNFDNLHRMSCTIFF